jgi:hypothetical protein
MKATRLLGSGLCACLAAAAGADNIYVISSGDPITDNAAVTALTTRGHTATLGVTYDLFDGSVNLAPYQTVYLQNNFNWSGVGFMPSAGQQQLVTWVNAGGRLVTSEWVTYYSAPRGRFGELEPILPGIQTFTYGSTLATTYAVVTPDPAINAGLPSSFSFNLYSYAGTETFADPKAGARVYYSTANSPTAFGLAGWPVGSGLVYSFGSTCGPDQLADPNFGRLFSNVMGAAGAVCYANCDGSTAAPILNVNDFVCFQQQFAAGNPYANCDGSTAAPVLNVNDFVCFQQQFAAGCP